MSLFPHDDSPERDPAYDGAAREPLTRAQRSGWTALVVALVLLLVLALLPAPYVIQQPGPVFNTLGTSEHEGEDRPLIAIEGAEQYPTDGALDMLTVAVVGTPDQRPSWFQIIGAWFDPSRAVIPIDEVYAPQQTAEEREAENQTLMTDSQQDAVAAALLHLGEDVTTGLSVGYVADDGPAQGKLQVEDVIVEVNGTHPDDLDSLRELIKQNGSGTPLTMQIEREGAEKTVTITPEDGPEGNPAPAIGIGVTTDYTFPFTVDIQLDNVGGPSAGMMFALGIIDKLTPGALTGGEAIAGTGTITADGAVGAIGGIRQKMFGAVREGADYFLAPETNCGEVVGHIPDGLEVFSVATLDEAESTVQAIAAGDDLSGQARCDVAGG